MFIFIAGNIGLDFCNTEVVVKGATVNLLDTNEDLILWAQESGFPLTEKGMSAGDIDEALRLRQALKNVILAKLEETTPLKKDLTLINQYLSSAPEQQQLQFGKEGFVLDKKIKLPTTSELFTQITQSVVTLLLGEQKYAVKKCANPQCILHFVDKSRTQQRKWCSMEACGNRLKVSAHHKRSKT